MALRNRKRIPVCKKFHDMIHGGNYKGNKMINLLPPKTLSDKRILTLEPLISPTNKEDFYKTIEEKGWRLISPNNKNETV